MTLYINILLFRESDGDTDRADLQGAGKAGEAHRQELQNLQEMGWLPSRQGGLVDLNPRIGSRRKAQKPPLLPQDAPVSWLT